MLDGGSSADGSAALPRARSTFVPSYTTASRTFVPVPQASVTLPASPYQWLVLASGLLSSTQGKIAAAEGRLMVGGAQSASASALVAGNTFAPWHTFHVAPAAASDTEVRVELRDLSQTATIRDLSIVALPMPPGADLHQVSLPDDQAVPNPPAAYLRLAFTPSRPGTYLVLAASSATEAPGVGSIAVWISHGSDTWPHAQFKVGRGAALPLFLARAVDLAAAPQTISWMASGDETVGSTIRFARIIAFRTDAFPDYRAAQDFGQVASTASSFVSVSSLASGTAPGDYLSIQTMLLWTDEAAPQIARGVRFATAGGLEPLEYLSELPPNVRVGHSRIGLVGADTSGAAENAFSSPSGGNVFCEESTIHRLRLSP